MLIRSGEETPPVFGIEGGGARIDAISTDREAIGALVERCNSGGLKPWQLLDVVEDFVQEEAML